MADTWRNKLRPSSFRGVPFEVKSREGKGGRRGPDHEYPDRDEGYPEDLGRKLRRYSVEAFLLASRLGGNYMPARDRLLTALEAKGPGEYIDLWGDAWVVQVRDFSWRESASEGGMVVFQISFVEYNKPGLHVVTADTGYAVGLAADKGGDRLVDDFILGFDARGNDQVSTSAISMADAALGQFNGILTRANLTNVSALGMGPVSSTLTRLSSTRSNLASLISSPQGLAGSIRSLLTLTLRGLMGGWSRYQAAQGLTSYGSDWPVIAPTTTMRAQAAANQDAMVALVRGLATVEAARASADIPFVVYDDAVAVRDQVAAGLDQRMMTAPDATYQALSTLRAASVRDITARGADLSRLSDVTNDADTPALVLAHRLWGDAGRETVVLERNPFIRHPGFIPGGMTLKVPTDG